MTSENADNVKGLALSADDEKQLHDFIANIPRFNSVMGELSRMMDEGQLDALSHALSALRFLKEGLNDEAVESLSTLGGRIAEAASALSSGEAKKVLETVGTQGGELSALIEQVGKMHRDGVFDSLVSASYAVKFLKDGLNDEAVENMASSIGDMMAVWRQYSSLVSNSELMSALTKISKLEKDGGLDAVIEAAYVMKFLRDGMNDEALTNLASIFSQLLTQWNSLHRFIDMMSSPTAERVLRMMTDENVQERLENAPAKKGGMSLLSFSDPDVKKGMGVAFEMLKILGEEFRQDDK